MYKDYDEIDFTWFEGREKSLKKIWRYNNFSDFYYRSNDFQHTLRVFYIINYFESDIKFIFKWIDFKKLQIMSLVHDDVEILIWDFQAWNKLKMKKEELLELDNIELLGIEKICKTNPKNIEWYNYKELLLEVFYKNTIISQIVKLFDHLDAFWEALNEYFAWNIWPTKNIKNKYWKIVLPYDYYIDRIKDHSKKYPLLDELFSLDKIPFNLNIPRIDFENLVNNYSPHTNESIKIDTWYEFYELWKNVITSNIKLRETFSLVNLSKWRFYDKEKNIL